LLVHQLQASVVVEGPAIDLGQAVGGVAVQIVPRADGGLVGRRAGRVVEIAEDEDARFRGGCADGVGQYLADSVAASSRSTSAGLSTVTSLRCFFTCGMVAVTSLLVVDCKRKRIAASATLRVLALLSASRRPSR
jgi:hypothetical protein